MAEEKKCVACGAALEYVRPALLPDRLNSPSARAGLYLGPQGGRDEFYQDPRWIQRDEEKRRKEKK